MNLDTNAYMKYVCVTTRNISQTHYWLLKLMPTLIYVYTLKTISLIPDIFVFVIYVLANIIFIVIKRLNLIEMLNIYYIFYILRFTVDSGNLTYRK